MSALAKFGTDQALGFLVGIGFLVVIQPTTPGGGLLLVLIALAIVNVTMQIIRLCLRWSKKDDGSSAIKIFLTYASEDRTTAESITFSLRERGYTVFLDRDDLPPGESFNKQIERAINNCGILVFLISPDSVADGRYTLTELSFARHKWPSPDNRVLPVMVRKTPLERVPNYLKAVTILEPQGNVAAEASAAVDGMRLRGVTKVAAEP
jgi:TIR domain